MYPVCASSTDQIPSNTVSSYGAIHSAGCPFPGTSGKTSFTDATAPAAFTWTGIKVNRPVTEIREQAGLISFKFMQGAADPVSGLTLTSDGYDVQLNWESPNERVSGYNIYRDNSLLVRLAGADNTSYTTDDAAPDGSHTYCIAAVYGSRESERVCVQSPFLTGISKINPSGSVTTCPNPLKRGNVLTVDLGNDFAGTQLSFYSVSGQLLRQAEASEGVYRQTMDFAPGVYILQIRKKSQTINRKIILN